MVHNNKRSLKDYLIISLKGLGMGAADVVPGVSGGTIAFISGIYEELINSIKSINPEAIKKLFKEGISAFWKHVNGTFLLFLVGGIFISIISLSRVITYALHQYPILIWSFFFGMILASTWFVGKKIKKVNAVSVFSFLIGTAIAFYITIAAPTHTPEALWFIFISGVVAICAMILPGISGSFILLLMGKYSTLLDAIHERDFKMLIVFASGCFIGIISFAQVISWLFKKFHNATIALLTGFMVGSLNKVWPWKQVIETRINSKGEEVPFLEKSIMPGTYADLTGNDPMILYALALVIVGFIVIFVFERFADQKTEKV